MSTPRQEPARLDCTNPTIPATATKSEPSTTAPGYRDYRPGYYAAYLLDPDGNNIEALYRDLGNRGHAPET